MIGKRYLKFPFGFEELPYKLRMGKEKTLAKQHLERSAGHNETLIAKAQYNSERTGHNA